MLSKDLYILSNNLSNYISNENTFLNDLSCLDNSILSYLNSKKNFVKAWIDQLNLNFKNISFDFNYSIIEQNSTLMKIVLSVKKNFLSYNINSASIDPYIIILQYSSNYYKMIYLISKEDTPFLYHYFSKTPLENIYSLTNVNSFLRKFWDDKYNLLKLLYSNFSKMHSLNNRQKNDFDITLACEYAEKYAIIPNPKYKDFTDIGGDCTNFVSQVIYTGGLKTSNTWFPYSNTWLRVKELYDYLINNHLAHPLHNNIGLDKGCLIQFLIPTTNRFSHTAFITHNIPEVDYLYCCHSYNKLNYPLSLTYPVRYKSMRSLMIN